MSSFIDLAAQEVDTYCWCGNCTPYWFDNGWVCTRTYAAQSWAWSNLQAHWVKATPTNPQDGGEVDILAIFGHSVFEAFYFDIFGFTHEDLDSILDDDRYQLDLIIGTDLDIDFHFVGTADPVHGYSHIG